MSLLSFVAVWIGLLHACHAYSSFLGQGVWNDVAPSSSHHHNKYHHRPKDARGIPILMKLRIGILGLPNVGKSSLFNALAQQSIAQAANFPFCTIDPNVAQVAIPDPYLQSLGTFGHSVRTVAATMEWVDVAGLAKGAHRGEGLGNQFLGTLRECNAVCHVVRLFEDPNIVHVDGQIDPVSDIEAIQLELLFADLAHVERRLEKSITSVPADERQALEQVIEGLHRGIPARAVGLSSADEFAIKSMGLLTLKPVMYAFNVDEVDYALDREHAMNKAKVILQQVDSASPSDNKEDPLYYFNLVSAKVESELALLSKEEQVTYLESIGVDNIEKSQESFSCNVLPNMARQLLGYSLVYTGPGVPPERSQTTRAHLFSNLSADALAGRIHGTIQKGFLRAEVTPASALLQHSTYVSAKEAGCVRSEGRDYDLQEHDVVCIKWK
jgi:GTP-binding protein YchF